MTTAFLWINAALYLVFAVWCTVAPGKTAEAIGFAFAKGGARSEYLVVYGGMELGFAIFFALCALRPAWATAGLVFATCLYAALALYRVASLFFYDGLTPFVYTMCVIEIAFAITAGLLLYRSTSTA